MTSIEKHFLIEEDQEDEDQYEVEYQHEVKLYEKSKKTSSIFSQSTNDSLCTFQDYSFPSEYEGVIFRSQILDKFLEQKNSEKNENTANTKTSINSEKAAQKVRQKLILFQQVDKENLPKNYSLFSQECQQETLDYDNNNNEENGWSSDEETHKKDKKKQFKSFSSAEHSEHFSDFDFSGDEDF